MVCDALEGFRCCESLAAGVCTGALITFLDVNAFTITFDDFVRILTSRLQSRGPFGGDGSRLAQ